MMPSLKEKLRDMSNAHGKRVRVFALDDDAHEIGPILLGFENYQKRADAYALFRRTRERSAPK